MCHPYLTCLCALGPHCKGSLAKASAGQAGVGEAIAWPCCGPPGGAAFIPRQLLIQTWPCQGSACRPHQGWLSHASPVPPLRAVSGDPQLVGPQGRQLKGGAPHSQISHLLEPQAGCSAGSCPSRGLQGQQWASAVVSSCPSSRGDVRVGGSPHLPAWQRAGLRTSHPTHSVPLTLWADLTPSLAAQSRGSC